MRGDQSGYDATVPQSDRAVRLRVDAARNLDRILAAAREAFAEGGLNVGTEQIARRAGVGKGTLYRRFPTKRGLVNAVLDDLVTHFEALAAEADANPDPLEGLRRYLVSGARTYLDNAVFFQATVSHLGGEITPELRERILAACAGPLRRAQQAGVVRADLEPLDLVTMAKMLAVAGAGISDVPTSPDRLDSYATLLLDGARPR
jgi:AcrR family transcriptional regulator